MELKPGIFIGSSSEDYKVAEKVAGLLSDIAECKLWKDVFELKESNYDNLASQIALYDYAILIATTRTPDKIISREVSFDSPRDNVLFELGLFAGGLGKKKVFFIVEEGLKIPSDLSGISLPQIPKRTARDFEKRMEECALKIKEYIKSKENTFVLGFLPSTALAYGYFVNFVER